MQLQHSRGASRDGIESAWRVETDLKGFDEPLPLFEVRWG
jgi:hypothetical protein